MQINATPMMRQYLEIKGEYKDAILFFRLGDFYEMFFEDAVEASKILGIALTSRNKGEPEPVPLCGVPWHSADQYINKLLKSGKKVAICEQIEDPRLAKGVVKRQVIRVVTPGVVFSGLDDGSYNLLVSVYNDGEGNWGLAKADASTGLFEAGVFQGKAFLEELVKLAPSEIVVADSEKLDLPFEVAMTKVDPKFFSEQALADLNVAGDLMSPARMAAGAIVNYLKTTQREISHMGRVASYRASKAMRLDDTAVKHLEILKTMISGERRGSLLWLIDKTNTPMGARLLREFLMTPLADCKAINDRLNSTARFVEDGPLRSEFAKKVSDVSDIERLLARCATGVATPRDLSALGRSLKMLPEIRSLILSPAESLDDGALVSKLAQKLDDPKKMGEKITESLIDDPPVSPRDGGIFKTGVCKEVDELREISSEGKSFLSRLEQEEKQKTGLPIKIRYNRVFGYYIEVTKSYLGRVPERYIRKQTLANAERFYTPELKAYEEKVLTAEERIKEIEFDKFVELRTEVSKISRDILAVASALAELDCYHSFASLAVENNYARPIVHEGTEIEIKEGRHPVVEKIQTEERFVPNDVTLDGEKNRLIIITGPNMAGKSTVMRQTAVICLLAHIGSYVPAKSARIGIIDRIFTRVGAADALIRGQSTFMVEMSEAAQILTEATDKSLIIIDEIGRGTSTFDGLAIAWAVAEDLAGRVKARTLFATHYHELTDLGEKEGIRNMNIAVKEWGGKIIFLRKLVNGPTSHSYGIQVGEMAGLPVTVVQRAREVLSQLEELNEMELSRLVLQGKKPQLELFSQGSQQIVDLLNHTDVSTLTPIEAMNLIDRMKKLLEA